MALFRVGDTGEPVRDIQERLHALGFSTAPDTSGVFAEGTSSAVIAFQKSRRLTADGMVGRETWRTMVDAGHLLGDRLLYHRMPMLHGDDVADLQRRLNAIGFDTGSVDGIFGATTLRAVPGLNTTMYWPGILFGAPMLCSGANVGSRVGCAIAVPASI